MDNRRAFVAQAQAEGAKISLLGRRFGISRKSGHKWLARAKAGEPLSDRPRRPRTSPKRSDAATEQAVLALRSAHPTWGGRKLRRRLSDQRKAEVPSASTITAILRRHDQLRTTEPASPHAFTRFEHDRPNALLQMDFKGHFPIGTGRCHPLAVLDDHSRYVLCLAACGDERGATVRTHLTEVFRQYGLPERMNADNGAPWGSGPGNPYTPLVVWLMRLGVRFGHSRPYHPQTNGKAERFNRTLLADVIQGRLFPDLPACQRAFDRWRTTYNTERPHQALALALALATPVSRYRISPHPFPEQLPEVIYGPDDSVRRVQQGGWLTFRGREISVPKAFQGERLAVRPTQQDGVWEVVFIRNTLITDDFRDNPTV